MTLPPRLEPNPYRPSLIAGEKETLAALLDYHRAIVVHKVSGVSEDDARRPMVPSGTSLLRIVQHLANVELSWFPVMFAGLDADLREDSWAIGEDETTTSVCARYEAACERSRAVTAAAGVDDVAVHSWRGGKPTLRWVLGHMLEETARHCGHLDILREQLDGTTGD